MVAHGEIVFEAPADVQTAPYRLKVIYGVHLLIGAKNASQRETHFRQDRYFKNGWVSQGEAVL